MKTFSLFLSLSLVTPCFAQTDFKSEFKEVVGNFLQASNKTVGKDGRSFKIYTTYVNKINEDKNYSKCARLLFSKCDDLFGDLDRVIAGASGYAAADMSKTDAAISELVDFRNMNQSNPQRGDSPIHREATI